MSIASRLSRAAGAALLLFVFGLTLLAPSSGEAAGRIGVHKARNLGALSCVKPRPAARAKRVARRLQKRGCRRTRTVAPSAPPPPLYWGTWAGSQFTGEEAPWDMSAVSRYESSVGKPLSLLHFSSPFANCSSSKCTYYPFPEQAMENVRSHGAIPFFSWASQALGGGLDQPDFQLSDVIAGNFDGYIREFAEEAQAWGNPFFLRFNWEMNGDWFPWSEGVNGNNPGEYVAAWRHVHDIFTSVGAGNATWVWCPNVDPTGKFLDLAQLYPGDEYVDWTCLDGYNWGTNPVSPRGWSTFDWLFETTYKTITETIAPTKPMVIGEVGSTEVGGSKAKWIQEMTEALPVKYPRVRGVMWFDKWIEDMDWPLDSSPTATQAFAQAVQSPAYMANSYSSLGGGAVQPPA